MEKWLVQAKKADFDRLGKLFGIHPVIARLIRNRGMVTEEEFSNYLGLTKNDEELESPFLLKDMEKAMLP